MAEDDHHEVHWFSIGSSSMIFVFVSGMVALIMLRKLFRDISRYNHLETPEESLKETGWKLVHADVFRPPGNPDLLCVFVGTGVQFFTTFIVTIIFAFLGFHSPLRAMILLWNFMGLFAGYTSARLYKIFRGREWKKITLKTALMFPSTFFAILFALNFSTRGKKSSCEVPFRTMFALIFSWFGISVPLVFQGGYAGFKRQLPIQDPVTNNNTPRQIPEQPWYMNPSFSILTGGTLPFVAILIELFLILDSIQQHQFDNIFSFLFILFLILIITCAETTIVLCYFQLCSEDYHWWWRSYLTSGSSALYLFLYAAFYFTNFESNKPLSGILCLGYLLLVSYAFFIVSGTVGFFACFWFTRLIYSSVKID